MAFIVETGAGLSDATSYCSVEVADAWHAGRGITLWADLSDTEKQQALTRATDAMVQTYRTRWAGYRKTSTQRLDWPRYEVPIIDGPSSLGCFPSYYSDSAVPLEVQQAAAEMAFKGAFGDLSPDQAQQKKSVTVGPIAIVYADGAPQIKRYVAIDRMLAPLLVGGGSGGLKVVRC